jgi:hypothetical protein
MKLLRVSAVALVAGATGYLLVAWVLGARAGASESSAPVVERRDHSGAAHGGTHRQVPRRAAARPRLRVSSNPVAAPIHANDFWYQLRADDPIAAQAAADGVSRAMLELIRTSWERSRGSGVANPAACFAPGVAPDALLLTVRIRSQAEVLTLDSAAPGDGSLPSRVRACLARYFEGESHVHDEDVGGPFPEVEVVLPVPVAATLESYLDDSDGTGTTAEATVAAAAEEG